MPKSLRFHIFTITSDSLDVLNDSLDKVSIW